MLDAKVRPAAPNPPETIEVSERIETVPLAGAEARLDPVGQAPHRRSDEAGPDITNPSSLAGARAGVGERSSSAVHGLSKTLSRGLHSEPSRREWYGNRKRVWLSCFVALLGLVIVLANILWTSQKTLFEREEAQRWETHTREVLLETALTLSALQDVETGQRDFILTAEAQYLEPYIAGLGRVDQSINHLAVLTQDNPTQQVRLGDLRKVAAARFDVAAETVALVRAGNQSEALAIVSSGRGKSLTDEARTIVDAITAEESRLLDIRHATATSAAEQNDRLNLAADAIGIVLLLAAGLATALALRATGRLQLSKAIAASEQRLKLFVDLAPANIAIFDTEMRYLAVSRRFVADHRLTGETPQSLLGRSHYELFPELPEHRLAVHRRVLAGETLSAQEDTFLRQDGHTEWLSWDMTPWYQPDGSLGGAMLSSESVTDRKNEQLALAQSEERLRGLLDTVVEGIILATVDGHIVSANPAATRIFGYANEQELVGQPLTILMPKLEASHHDGYLASHRTTGETRVIGLPGRQLLGVHKDGSEFPLELSVSSFQSGNTRYFTGVLRDISERQRSEAVERHAERLEHLVKVRTRELEETQAQLVQAAKMEALGRLAGGVAHDFNNVLQAVQGGVTLANKRLRTDPAAAEHVLELASAAVERGTAVTGRLLAFARRSQLLAAPIAPLPLLEDTVQLLRPALGPRVTLQVEAGPDVPFLFADNGQLESVLVNLANNARDALVKSVGTIRFTAVAAAAPGDAPGDAPAQLAPGNYVRLSVVDDGMGMPPDVLARVSEVFFTTKPKGQGTGLGVAMARGFAEQSGGALTIESAPGQGTTVSLWLPVAPAKAVSAKQTKDTAPEDPAPRLPGMAILLVDDEPGLRAVLAALLTDEGNRITEAGDGASALALLDAGLVVDVLVTDFAMPGGMDGLELVQEARRRRPGLPAVLVTGHPAEASDVNIGHLAELGPFAVLGKPFSAKTLTARLARLLRG
jgi:PAS domain S-box-containing protein